MPPRVRVRRNLPLPAPRVPDGGADEAGPVTDPATAPPVPPRRRRVRMLVDVVDHPDEVAYATGLFEERGWSVRPAEAEERARAGEARRAALAVEVRLHGARFGAVRTAVAEVERLLQQAELGAWVRDAALVEHERPPRTTYQMHRAPTTGGRVGRMWTWLGGLDEQRAVTVAAGPDSREAAEAEFAARPLGGREFSPDRHGLRVPGHSDANPPRDETPEARRVRLAWLTAGSAGLVLAIVCGMYVVRAEGAWKLLPALLSTAGALPLGRMAKETRDRGRPAQWAAGVAGTSALAGFGALVGQDVTPGDLWAGVLVLGAAAFAGTGVVLAVRRTFFTRHAAWLVPLSVPVVWSVVGRLGGQMHDAYLDRFGIRAATVPTPALGRYLAAAEPMGLALGSVLFSVAILGWLRHFHLGRDGSYRLFAVVIATLLAVTYALTAVALGADRATGAADRAAVRTATLGTSPPDYFGLHGHLVCVRPVDPTKPVPVENGPLPTAHPVLSFGSTTDWIWLWDPSRDGKSPAESFAVRREDVQLLPTKNPAPKRCPAS
ncbi:hypothetical protein I2W78_26710 [Streptomyces spinoverrucosus]|uniref:hypothetical protein n=1 Tax=Streptomyces spinoverrucosus TaxID=284043 RepID=UPI0018C3F977|nr:hypothetical protein [Streptomyces spinoverrucosus]MBG0855343.1 hypothetical protein [Streptomyces spinoverrucosus]